MAVKSNGLNAHSSWGRAVEFEFSAWSSVAQFVLWVGIQSAGELMSWDFQVRILHYAEEDNLSPLDSNATCLCQIIEISNNKHVYREGQVRKPNCREINWAECSLIIGTDIQQRKTTCLLSIWISLACARASKFKPTNMYIARARFKSQMAVKANGLNTYSS